MSRHRRKSAFKRVHAAHRGRSSEGSEVNNTSQQSSVSQSEEGERGGEDH